MKFQNPSFNFFFERTNGQTDVPTFIFFLSILHVKKVSNDTKSTQQYPLLLRIKSYFQRLWFPLNMQISFIPL